MMLMRLVLVVLLSVLVMSAERLCPPGKIWKPLPGTTWEWQIGASNANHSANVQMYDIDLFDSTEATINSLHAENKIVICYFSAGTWENWRPDASQFPASVLGNTNGWPGERWLDIREGSAIYPIMQNRISLAAQKGCDGLEPDNIDEYCNNPGFPITAADQIYYNTWLATEAHNYNLSIGLKNDLNQVTELISHFDWALDEQCVQYDECDCLLPFIQANKAVFGTEYEGNPSHFCPCVNDLNFSWLKKKLSLNTWTVFCLPEIDGPIPDPHCA